MDGASIVCPHCGRDVQPPSSLRSAATVLLAVASAIVGGIVGTLLHLEGGTQLVLAILAIITIVTVIVVVRWIVSSRARAVRRNRGEGDVVGN